MDIRKENPFPEGHKKVRKGFVINPDVIGDFKKIPFNDNSFKLVVFDMPHMITLGETSHFKKIYGKLNKETWREDIRKGLLEGFRVLENYGVLIFKWNNCEIPFKEIESLFPIPYLFANIFSSRTKTDKATKWFCFMKIPEQQLTNSEGKNE